MENVIKIILYICYFIFVSFIVISYFNLISEVHENNKKINKIWKILNNNQKFK